jgi:hypothetical protein
MLDRVVGPRFRAGPAGEPQELHVVGGALQARDGLVVCLAECTRLKM